ncbi:hypothetical protein AAGG52_07120 [Bacillus licheniformis]
MYIPAQRAQITDSTEDGRRSEVFAVLHSIERLGAAVGPAAGLAVYSYQPSLMFGFQACAFCLYWLAVYFKMPEAWRSKKQKELLERENLLSAKRYFFIIVRF